MHWESLPYLFVGAFLAGLGLVAMLAGPRAKPNLLFAAFLFLVAANFTTNWLAYAYVAHASNASVTTDPWIQASHALNLFDAAALLWFAAAYPRPSTFEQKTWVRTLVVAVLAASVVHAFFDPVRAAAGTTPWASAAEMLLFGGAYLGALALAIRNLAKAEYLSVRKAARPLVAGLLVAVSTRVGLLESDFRLANAAGPAASLAVRLALTGLVFACACLALRRMEPAQERRRTRPWLLAAAAMTAGASAVWILSFVLSPRFDPLVSLSLLYTARWVFFAALVTYALSRYSFLGAKPRLLAPLRSGSALLLAAAAFVALHVFLGPLQGHAMGLSAGDALATGGALLVAVGLLAGRSTLTRVPRTDGAHDPLRQRKLEAYRALVEADLLAGGDGESPGLARHRDRLGLQEKDHRDVQALILAEKEVRDAHGPLASLPAGHRLEEVFPSGPTTWTFLARDRRRRVVVKALRPEWRSHPRVAAAFLREGRLLRRINHPNVVRVLELTERPPAIVLEHAAGGNLADRVKRFGPLSSADLERLAHDLLQGLEAIHAARAVHRDLKPENVLFAADGRALLADFGAAWDTQTDGTRIQAPGEEIGTVLYMAPEQVLGKAVDARTDLYALGTVLVFAATGRHYLHAEGLGEFEVKRHIVESRPRPFVPLPDGLELLARKCLQKTPEKRPATAPGALAALRPLHA